MGVLTLERLLFDPADTADSSNVGAYLRAGSDGDLISSTLVSGKEGVDAYIINSSIAVSATIDYSYAEDSAHISGDKLASVGAVRQDTLASSVSADGDYGNFKINSRGGLWSVPVGTVADDAADDENPVKIGGKAYDAGSVLSVVTAGDRVNLASDLYRRIFINDAPNIAVESTLVTVGATAVALPTTALAGRTRIIIQNISSNSIWIGPSDVTTSGATSGLKLGKGNSLALEAGPGVVYYGIAAGAGNDVVIFEQA